MGNLRNKSNRGCKSSRNFTSEISKSDLGTLSEHEAMMILIRHGFWVAKSCHVQSPFDMVAVHPNGCIHLLDIKTKSFRKDKSKINRSPSAKQKKLNIKIMTIDQSKVGSNQEDQKDFLKEIKDLLNNFPNKDMFDNVKEPEKK